jgi:rare lipoprotein A
MITAEQKFKLLLLVIVCQLIPIVAVCSPLNAEEKTAIPKTSAILRMNSSLVKNTKPVIGKASYYAKRYNGRRTSSGAIEDPRLLTAAHSALPFGTRLEVKNLANNESVVVTVNDRCRKRGFEHIDLSREAARRLGFLGKGIARVQWIEVPKK